jgi:circadian clock protein KaiB
MNTMEGVDACRPPSPPGTAVTMNHQQPGDSNSPVSLPTSAALESAQRMQVLHAISNLLEALQPYRGSSLEINQIAQELSFLHSSMALGLRMPTDWQSWLYRIVRTGTLDRVPQATEHTRNLLGYLGDVTYRPTEKLSKPVVASPQVAPVARPQVKYFLRLFISGNTRPSRQAMENLQVLSAQLGSCEMEIVDIHENPEMAESERIVATPTLLRDFPLPKRKIIGDLSDISTVMLILSA